MLERFFLHPTGGTTDAETKGVTEARAIAGRAFRAETGCQPLGQLEKLEGVQEGQRLQRRVRAQEARASGEGIRRIEYSQRRMGSGAPIERVKPPPITVPTLARDPRTLRLAELHHAVRLRRIDTRTTYRFI